MYHLELPQLYLSAGRFEFISWNPFWGQPPLGEMLYTLGIALNSLETAAVIGWIVQVVLLLGLLGMITKITDVSSAWIGVAALMAGYTFRWMMSAAYVDGLAALFGFAALLCIVTWFNERAYYWLIWLAIFAGLALWGKLTAGVLLISLILVILTEERWRSINAWKIAAGVVLLAALVFFPWLLITTANTGNPYRIDSKPSYAQRQEKRVPEISFTKALKITKPLRAGVSGVAALMAGYTFRWMMSAAYVDGLAALFGFAALLCIVTWFNERAYYWLIWLAIFAGLALWGKLTAGVLLISLILVILTEERWRSIN
ncbi:unnamed protein product, partial [marine sediment metagenome]